MANAMYVVGALLMIGGTFALTLISISKGARVSSTVLMAVAVNLVGVAVYLFKSRDDLGLYVGEYMYTHHAEPILSSYEDWLIYSETSVELILGLLFAVAVLVAVSMLLSAPRTPIVANPAERHTANLRRQSEVSSAVQAQIVRDTHEYWGRGPGLDGQRP